MKWLTIWTIFAVSLTAQAQRIPDPTPGLQAAMQFCDQLWDSNFITPCVQLESGANWVTREALPICSLQNFDNEKIECLGGIIDKEIRPEEVRVCDSLTFNDEKAKCLADIQRPFPYRTRLKVDPQPGRDEASTLCQSFFFDDDKKRCLNEMTSADLFTVDAVRFCAELFTDKNKIQCLARLKDHMILPEEVTLCKKVFTDEKQLKCLEGVNRKYRKTRAL